MKKTVKNSSNSKNNSNGISVMPKGSNAGSGHASVLTDSKETALRHTKATQEKFVNEKEENTMKNDAMKKDTTMSMSQASAGTNEATQREKYMWLQNKELLISPDIQRKLNPARVAAIAETFSPLVANPIKVSFRDGKYYIFDGMHTRMAMVKLNGSDDFPIFCRVYYGLTKEDEARLFASQFGIYESVSAGYRLRALEVAKDPAVLDFLKITRDSGFEITLGSRHSGNGRICASHQAFMAYQALGGSEYGRMLRILHKTWAGDSWSVNKYILGGMTRFMKMYEVKGNSFVKAFREVRQEEIKREAMRFVGMTKDGAYATAFAEIYDRNSSGVLKEIA